MRKLLRIAAGFAIVMITAALIYTTIYFYLASNGKYIPVVSGRSSIQGIGLTDTTVWEPEKLNVRTLVKESLLSVCNDNSDLDTLTFLYVPMILIDWTYFHRSKKLL